MVREVVAATEMRLQPASPGAGAPDAPICEDRPGQVVSATFRDRMEYMIEELGTDAFQWTLGGSPWIAWTPDASYATSVDRNADVHDLWAWEGSDIAESSATIGPVTVPEGGLLHFRHSYHFENGAAYWPPTDDAYDGGVLEYSTNGGVRWKDAGPLFIDTGYTGVISDLSDNPLVGHAAFTASSNGYRSSRLDLSSLAGKHVLFRWRIVTDSSGSDLGWYLDDVQVYACRATADSAGPSVTATRLTIPVGESVDSTVSTAPVRVSWKATDPMGVARTVLRHREASSPWEELPLSPAWASTATVDLVPDTGAMHRFRPRAVDGLGNPSTGPEARGRVQDVEDTTVFEGGSGVAWVGAWTAVGGGAYTRGTDRHSSNKGARATLILEDVAGVAWVSHRGRGNGRAIVLVDGVRVATIDLYSSSPQRRVVVFSTRFADGGDHRVEVRVAGTHHAASTGSRVDLDAFLVLRP
jgi:hypothetical protein